MECPREISDYILLKKIKSSPVTDMFVGKYKNNNEIVFIKVFRKSGLNSETRKKLNGKIEILKKLRGSRCIIYEKALLKDENYYYLIFEYCNGGNLSEYAKDYIKENKKPINEFFIQKIIKQLVSGIESLHSKNIIHRNIKLENILLNFDNYLNIAKNGKLPEELTFENKSLNREFTVKIADFKESKELKEDNGTSTVIRNVNNAPEIFNSGKGNAEYSYKADLWSLGAITYELLTGLPPFEGKTSEEIFKSIEEGKYTLPNNLKCSIEIITFINGLLQYYPEKRLNLEQIKSHHFLNKNPEEFQYINLSINEKEKIEINTKDNDNLFWIFFKCNFNFNINKIDQEEIQKSGFQKMLENNTVSNSEIKRTSEEEEIEKKREKLKIDAIKADSEEEIKKCQLENENLEKEQEKLLNDEKNIIEELEKQKSDEGKNVEEKEKIVKVFELKLEKNKSDKETNNDKIKNNELNINEKKKILEQLKSKEEENRKLKEEIKRIKEKPKDVDSNNKIEFEIISDLDDDDDNHDDVEFEDLTDNKYNFLNIDKDYVKKKFLSNK